MFNIINVPIMKRYLYIAVLFCGISMAAYAQSDVYYIPSKKAKTVTIKNSGSSQTTKNYDSGYSETENGEATSKYYTDSRDVDEYNRRSKGTASGDESVSESEASDSETSGADDAGNYNYTKRIVRFYSPRGVMVSSPFYWDICYSDVWDAYYDGWAYVLPSYSFWTYAYDPWYYNRWWYRTCWDFTWGWYDPWWGSSYWGWHRPLYWGWDRPWYGGWAHGGNHHHFNPGWNPGPRHPGGGRDFANNNGFQMGRASAGGRVMYGGTNNRSSVRDNGQTNMAGRGNLSKSFRTGSFENNQRTNNSNTGIGQTTNSGYTRTTRGGGGFSRSNGGTVNNSGSATRQYGNSGSTYNNRSGNTESTVPNNRNNSSSGYSRSFGNSNSTQSSSRGGGFSSGSSRSGSVGGGGFSRGGGRR